MSVQTPASSWAVGIAQGLSKAAYTAESGGTFDWLAVNGPKALRGLGNLFTTGVGTVVATVDRLLLT